MLRAFRKKGSGFQHDRRETEEIGSFPIFNAFAKQIFGLASGLNEV
jgi:hypothetical protein